MCISTIIVAMLSASVKKPFEITFAKLGATYDEGIVKIEANLVSKFSILP